MSTTVHKYPIDLTDSQTLCLPVDAVILHVGEQRGSLFLWASHDTVRQDEPYVERRIEILGTGHVRSLPHNLLLHIGTLMLHDGTLVFHVFEDMTNG